MHVIFRQSLITLIILNFIKLSKQSTNYPDVKEDWFDDDDVCDVTIFR